MKCAFQALLDSHGQLLMMPAAFASDIDATAYFLAQFAAFGASSFETAGQTFTPDATQTTLTGSMLFESATQTMNAAGTLQEFAFTTSLALTAGSTYVAFISISNLPAQQANTFGMPFGLDSIAGEIVFPDAGTDYASLTSTPWNHGRFGRDFWFKASFGAVPEPASLALFGLGLVGLAAARRRATTTA